MSNIELGSKNKYQRMDSEHDNNSSSCNLQKDNTNDCRRYVMVCAFFASVNSVLLGYGMQPLYIFDFTDSLVNFSVV